MNNTQAIEKFQSQAIVALAEYRGGKPLQRKGVSPKTGPWEINEIEHNVEIQGNPQTFVQRISKEEAAKHPDFSKFPLPAKKGEIVLLTFSFNEADKGAYYIESIVEPVGK